MEKMAFNGERLKSIRQMRALTLAALQEKTGISKQSLSLYENGMSRPDFEKGQAIANALNVPYEFLCSGDVFKAKTQTTYFRSLVATPKIKRTAQAIKLEYIAKAYEALATYVEFPDINLPTVEYLDKDCAEFGWNQDALLSKMEGLASKVREYWSLGEGPIIDLQYVLESNGIIVTSFDTESDSIDAFSQRIKIEDREICIIAVDESKSEARIQFDMAHELAHILFHPWSEDIESISKEEFRTREQEANAFAGAFLLPRESFAKDILAHPTDIRFYLWLKNKWKVSIQAMLYRSNQIGLISNSQFQYLMRQISQRGWKKREPDDEPYALKENVLQGAVDLLINEAGASIKQVLKLFSKYGVSFFPTEIEKLLHLAEGTLQEKRTDNLIQLKVIPGGKA